MRGIFPTLLAFGFGLFVLIMVWRLLTKGGKVRRASISDDDIDATAAEIIDNHGDAADTETDRLIQKCMADGDFDGEAVWQRVAKAVKKLQSDK